MAFLDKFLGSDQALSQPDFDKAPTVDIRFSDIQLRFQDPAHTALYPIHDWPESMDIFDNRNYEKIENGRLMKNFHSKGWDLKGRFNRERGGVIVDGSIEKYTGDTGIHSYLDKKCFETYVMNYIQRNWGRQNKGAKPGSLGEGPYVYPVTGKELQYVKHNEVIWCHVEVYIPGKVPVGIYFTPITSEHLIVFRIRFDMYQGLDFFSPETNIKEACYQVVDNFMSNFHIAISDETKKQQAQLAQN